MGDEENRVHARIHVSTTITVASPEGNIDATLRDLSKGGARFVTRARRSAASARPSSCSCRR